MNHESVGTYLDRIGHRIFQRPDESNLIALQKSHLQSVPFENLSIHWGEPMDLSMTHLYQKIVVANRGGFCYESNGLFASLLCALGYKTILLSARVARKDGFFSPDFDHMAILVQLEEPWLVDVGFGDSFRTPLRLVPDIIQTEPGRDYRIDCDGEEYLVSESILEQGWKPQFKVTLRPRVIADFYSMFEFHRDSPDSHFRKAPLATVATHNGRKTLSGGKLINTTLDGNRIEREIDEVMYFDVLDREFGIRRSRT